MSAAAPKRKAPPASGPASASGAPAAKKVKSESAAAAAAASAAPKPKVEASEDVISGDRKKRAHGSKKKKPNRVSKHILEAAARKQAKEGGAAPATATAGADGEAKEEGKTAAAPKPRVHKPAKAAAAAPAVPVVESKLLALEYLQQWSTARASWKFQKVRQVFLLEHVYDKDLLPKKDFATLCEYIQELKGIARTRMLDEARKIVEEYQEWAANADVRAQEKATRDAAKADAEAMKDDSAEGEAAAEDKPAAVAAVPEESEEEQDKKKKRKAQRAEKVLSVLA